MTLKPLKLGLVGLLSMAFSLGAIAQVPGHSGNDLRGTWTAGTLSASAIIPLSVLLNSTNTEIAYCICITNGVPLTYWSGDITNILLGAVTGGAIPGSIGVIYTNTPTTNAQAYAWIKTNIDLTVTNIGNGGITLGTNGLPWSACEQIDGLSENHTVYGVGQGGTSAGTYLVKVRLP